MRGRSPDYELWAVYYRHAVKEQMPLHMIARAAHVDKSVSARILKRMEAAKIIRRVALPASMTVHSQYSYTYENGDCANKLLNDTKALNYLRAGINTPGIKEETPSEPSRAPSGPPARPPGGQMDILSMEIRILEKSKSGKGRTRQVRVHNIQLVVRLHHPGAEDGTWGLPLLPRQIEWDEPTKPTRGGTYHCWGSYNDPEWPTGIRVHFYQARSGKCGLQILLNPRYVLSSWVVDNSSAEKYFLTFVSKVCRLFTPLKYTYSKPRLASKVHMAIQVPMLNKVEDLKAKNFTGTYWLDFSKCTAELETTEPDDLKNIEEGLDGLPKLPWFIRKVDRVQEEIRGVKLRVGELEKFRRTLDYAQPIDIEGPDYHQ